MLTLTSCAINCKEPDCNAKIYKDGYCTAHYALRVGTDILKGLEGLFG